MARKTHEVFIQQVKEKNPNINVIGTYVDVKTRIRCKCLIDEYEWDADPRKLLKGTKCAVCSNRVVMPGVNDITTTHPHLVEYFKNKEDARKYVSGSEAKVELICPICKTTKIMRISNFVRFGLACNTCYKNKYGRKRASYGHWNKNTMQQYIDCNLPGYIVLDTKVESNKNGNVLFAYVQCPNKNHNSYWARWKNIQNGFLCKCCFYDKNNKIMWDKDIAYNYFKTSGFTMLNKEDFKSVDISVPCYDKDKFIYMINITNLKKYNNGERTFFSKLQYNPYAIHNIKRFCELYRPEYDIISTEYKGAHNKHNFIYLGEFDDNKDHDRVFETDVGSFIFGGVRHPLLTRSNGERMTESILNRYSIDFIPQKSFSDCKDKYTLPFDFYLPKYNLIIEIMGEQHEHAVELFGGEEKFKERIYHDKIKRDYLKSRNINILDIWYYDFKNMENIILSKINELDNTKLLPKEELS